MTHVITFVVVTIFLPTVYLYLQYAKKKTNDQRSLHTTNLTWTAILNETTPDWPNASNKMAVL